MKNNSNEVKLSTPNYFDVGTPINGMPKSDVKLSISTLEEQAKYARDEGGLRMANPNEYRTNVDNSDMSVAIIIGVLVLLIMLFATLLHNKKKLQFHEAENERN